MGPLPSGPRLALLSRSSPSKAASPSPYPTDRRQARSQGGAETLQTAVLSSCEELAKDS